MAEPNRTYCHIRVEHDEMPERVIHVGAEGVRTVSEPIEGQPENPVVTEQVSTPQDAPMHAAHAAAPVEELPVEEMPEVPLPKMRIGVLVFVALLVVVCVVWYLSM